MEGVTLPALVELVAAAEVVPERQAPQRVRQAQQTLAVVVVHLAEPLRLALVVLVLSSFESAPDDIHSVVRAAPNRKHVALCDPVTES